MLPVSRSQNEAHEIHSGKGLEVRLSLAQALSSMQKLWEQSSTVQNRPFEGRVYMSGALNAPPELDVYKRR
ncbi:hypothetical protein TNCV_4269041 [Trichonephila clavipes]|nr:hypothetical protein TNCV_4269041 [Trichonephila clavipes]